MPSIITLTMNPALDLTVQVPQLQQGNVNKGLSPHWDAAGKGVNVASILADAGLEVTVTGLLGAANPERFEALFAAKGITDQFVRVDGETRLNIKLNDPVAQQTTDVNLPGLQASAAQLAELQARLQALAHAGALLVLSGSLPPQVPSDFYAQLIAQWHSQGGLSVLDSSGEALRAGLAAGATILKPNIHELEEVLERPLEDEAALIRAARELLARGSELVAVSRGEQGALLVTASAAVRARPPQVQVVSTVGAGDAFVAGLVAARLRGLGLSDTARLATSYSLGAITRLGANLPAAEELAQLTAGVEVEDV